MERAHALVFFRAFLPGMMRSRVLLFFFFFCQCLLSDEKKHGSFNSVCFSAGFLSTSDIVYLVGINGAFFLFSQEMCLLMASAEDLIDLRLL